MAIEYIKDVIEKIKNKDFWITYDEAIDLCEIFGGSGVEYVWLETIGSDPRLMHVEIGMFSGVKLQVREVPSK